MDGAELSLMIAASAARSFSMKESSLAEVRGFIDAIMMQNLQESTKGGEVEVLLPSGGRMCRVGLEVRVSLWEGTEMCGVEVKQGTPMEETLCFS